MVGRWVKAFVCLFVCKICISRKMFVYNIIMFKSRRFGHVCTFYIYIKIWILCIWCYIRVFQYLYYIIILNLVPSNTVVKITIMYLKSSDSKSHGEWWYPHLRVANTKLSFKTSFEGLFTQGTWIIYTEYCKLIIQFSVTIWAIEPF